jgi:hypothetical protein
LVTLKAAARHELLLNKPASEDHILFEDDDLDLKDVTDVKLDKTDSEAKEFSGFYDD